MKNTIRKQTFETNSSAVHSLSISNDGREKSVLPMDDNGNIICELKYYFGKNTYTYDTQEEKLAYLITSMYYISGLDVDRIKETYGYEYLEEAICEYTGAKGIEIIVPKCYDEDESGFYDYYCGEEFGIDHQEQPEGTWDMIVDIFDKDAVVNFVFNKYVALNTRCD